MVNRESNDTGDAIAAKNAGFSKKTTAIAIASVLSFSPLTHAAEETVTSGSSLVISNYQSIAGVAGSGDPLNLITITNNGIINEDDEFAIYAYSQTSIDSNSITNQNIIAVDNDGGSLAVGINNYAHNTSASGTAAVNSNTITNHQLINVVGSYGNDMQSAGLWLDAYSSVTSGSAIANVGNNDITSDGIMLVDGTSDDDVRASGFGLFARADNDSGSSHATISANTVITAGIVTVDANSTDDDDAYAFGTYLYAHADADSGGNAALLISTNTISNQGVLAVSAAAENEANAYGLRLRGYVESRSGGNASGSLSQNLISNSGDLLITANSSNDDDTYAYGISLEMESDVYDGGEAGTYITANTINNSGTIIATAGNFDDSYGIKLRANSDTKSGASTASITANAIDNSGRIIADTDGSYLFATADSSSGGSAISSVNSNTVTNSGHITSEEDGLDFFSRASSATVATANLNNNSITNSGTMLTGDDGVDMGARANSSGSATANLTGNTVSNSGTIMAYDDGFDVEATAVVYNSGSATARIYNNGFSNSGTITTIDDDGIDLTSYAVGLSDNDTIAATINANTITNSGSINSDDKGITINAYRNGPYWIMDDKLAGISNNEITNTASGSIVAGDIGINLLAETDGDGVRSYDSSNTGSVSGGESYVDFNTITNNGSINTSAEEDAHGIQLAADATASGEINVSGAGSANINRYANVDAQGGSGSVSYNAISNTSLDSIVTVTDFSSGIFLYSDTSAAANTSSDVIASDTSSGLTSASASGSATSSAFADAGYSYILENSITNSGAISTIGEDADAIVLFADATAYADADVSINVSASAQSGSATAWGSGSATSLAVSEYAYIDDNTISNSGTVSTTGNGAQGIYLLADGSVEASGYASISGSATSASGGNATVTLVQNVSVSAIPGIRAEDYFYNAYVLSNTIVNSGAIETTGIASHAIHLFADATANASLTASGSASATASGGFSSSGSATLTVDNDVFASGGYANVYDNTITNSGTIQTQGNGAHGIYLQVDASATVSYSGSFSATASGGSGFSTVNNTASSVRATAGLALIDDNSINNTGRIETSGDDADGIRLLVDANVYKYGNFSGISSLTTGDATLDANTINNSGYIHTTGEDADGISLHAYAYGDNPETSHIRYNSIVNNGEIIVAGTGIQVGQYDDPSNQLFTYGNTIDNFGTIISYGDDSGSIALSEPVDQDDFIPGVAIFVGGEDSGGIGNDLNIGAPAYLAGHILVEEQANVDIDLISGASHSVRWTIMNETSGGATADYVPADIDAYGDVPWFVDDSSKSAPSGTSGGYSIYATMDPSAFAAAPNMVADLAEMASDMSDSGDGLWVSARANRMNYDGDDRATLDQDTQLDGIAVGYTGGYGQVKLTAMAGYADATLEVDSVVVNGERIRSFEADSDGFFAGLFARGDLGPLTVGAGITGGSMSHDQSRFINDNVQYMGAAPTADTTFDSTWFSPELMIGLPIHASDALTVMPTITARYVSAQYDAYTEEGSAGYDSYGADAHVDERDIGLTEVRAGIDVAHTTPLMSLSGRIGYLSRTNTGDDSVSVDMINDTNDVPFFYQDINAVYGGFGFSYNLGEAASVSFDADLISDGGTTGGSGKASLKMKF